MILAKVVGTVVATRKDERLVASKLLVARPLDVSGKVDGNYVVAVDTVDAGVGAVRRAFGAVQRFAEGYNGKRNSISCRCLCRLRAPVPGRGFGCR